MADHDTGKIRGPQDGVRTVRRPDRYDIMGLILLGIVAAFWIAHFVLPTPPPLPP